MNTELIRSAKRDLTHAAMKIAGSQVKKREFARLLEAIAPECQRQQCRKITHWIGASLEDQRLADLMSKREVA